jgi:YYY domain-containing protein
LLSVAYLAWLAASLRVLTFARGTLIAAAVVLAAVGAVLAAKRRGELAAFLRQSGRLILAEEAVFAIVFVMFLLIRYGNGDLWHFYLGGERPMDFAYLNAVLKTIYFPPYDPWFAGGQMNYYYFGFVLVAAPIKLLGIVPALAYNIVLPMLAALTAMGAFSVAFNLFRMSDVRGQRSGPTCAIWVGVLAAVFVVFIGNLGELNLITTKLSELGASQFRSTIPGLASLVDTIRGLAMVISGKPLQMNTEWWYWNASRIMTNGEINEFPFFTFLYSDLHAHMIAFPLTVLMLGIALGWALRRRWRSTDAVVSVVIGAVVVGVARPNNTWDYPTYLALTLVALFVSGLRGRHRNGALHAAISGALSLGLFGAAWVLGGINDIPTFIGLAAIVLIVSRLLHQVIDGASEWRWVDLAAIGVMGLSVLYFRPYIATYATAYSSVELWNGPRTPVQAYLLVHGIFLFPILVYLLVQVRRMGWRWLAAALQVNEVWWVWALFAVVLAAVAVVMLALIDYSVIVIAAPLMALTLLVLMRRHLDSARRFVLLGVLMALALTLAVEGVVLKGDIGRMNTVFKFYLQVWIILAIAAAVMTGWVVERSRRWSSDRRVVWTMAIVALVASGLLYPVFAARAKINDRFDKSFGPTLDAMAFMTVAQANEQGQEYSFREEYDALIWMQDNLQGTPVVAESAAAPEYRSLRNRVPMYTGLPSILGYNYHQKQQRSILGSEVVDRRVADVNQLFTTIDPNQAMSLIRKYDVSYVIVGYPERLYYPAQGLAKFDQMVSAGLLRVVYKNEHVTLYQVVK